MVNHRGLPSRFDPRHLGERHGAAVRHADVHPLQRLGRQTFARGAAHDDGHGILARAQLAHRQAARVPVERARHVGTREAEPRRRRVVDAELERRLTRAEIVPHVRGTRHPAQLRGHRRNRLGQAAELVGEDAHLDRRAHRRPLFEPLADHLDSRQPLRRGAAQPGERRLDIRGLSRRHDHLGEVRAPGHAGDVVVEARRAAPDEARDRRDRLPLEQQPLELARGRVGAIEVAPLRQLEVHDELVAVGRRKELLPEKPRAEQRQRDEGRGAGEHQTGPAQRQRREHAGEAARHRRGARGARPQRHFGERRRHQYGEQIGDGEREDHHDRNRAGEIGGAALGEKHRQERRDGRPGRRRERHCELAHGVRRRAPPRDAAVEPPLDVLRDDDRVVDEHAEREHERGDRDLVEHPAAEREEREGGEGHQRDDRSDHQAEPQSHRQHHHPGDDQDAHEQRIVELGEPRRDPLRLEGDGSHLERRQAGHDLVDPGAHLLAETHGVRVLLRDDAEPHRHLAIQAHPLPRRLRRALPDAGDRAQRHRGAGG